MPAAAAPTKHHRAGGAIELRDGDHHRRLDRQQAALRGAPLLERLELDRGHGEVGDIERGERRLGRPGVVIGRPPDQREPGQRHDGVDDGPALVEEEALHGRSCVEPGGEGRDHAQPARLERGDDAVIVGGVAGQQVGAHQQQTDRAGGSDAGQPFGALGEPPGQARVVDADLGVVDRQRHLGPAAQRRPRPVRIAIDQQPDHVGDVLLRARQPILQGQEVGADVLGRARDETQDPRQAA